MAPRSEDPKLIIRVITFKLVQPICPRYINVTDRQRTDNLTIAIPRFALRASRGNNGVPGLCMQKITNISVNLLKLCTVNCSLFSGHSAVCRAGLT